MLGTEEFQTIKNVFAEFGELCQTHGIKPIILYIPTGLQIYAPYTIGVSGSHLLAVRERQIAARKNTENAIQVLARESRVDLVSLTSVFEGAAAEGKMLYYSLDTHWNEEGREIAARFIAEMLKKRFLVP